MFPSNFNIPMGPPMTRGPFDTSIPRPELDLKYAEFPMGPPIKGEGASELYKTIPPDFRLPPQPMSEMSREDFERIK